MRYFQRGVLGGLLALWLCLVAGVALAEPVADLLKQSLKPGLQKSALKVDDSYLAQGVAEFYESRNWAPVWDDARFKSLLNEIADLETDGLNPEDYGYSALKALANVGDDPARRAEREKLATRAYLLALVHLFRGKVDPVALDAHWNFDMRSIDPEQGLKLAREAVENNKLPAIFQQARPTLVQYNATRTALARLRGLAHEGGWPQIPAGAPLKPGMNDPRVPVLRQRLEAAGLLAYAGDQRATVYDKATVQAVQRFQRESYMSADGVLGAGTVRELNVPVEQRIGQLRANLERMRWFLSQFKDDFVLIDIAGYRVFYMHDNQPVWSSPVQIGKTVRQTPIFKAEISYVTLSPTWTVPPTILKEDSLPAIRRNQSYLTRNRIKVLDASGQELAPSAVNWSNPGNITLRQDAGPGNSLGQLVVRFPNDYAIYMHDTPHQELFGSKQRAFSSGCIRVEKIHELVVMLLNDPEKWSRETLEKELTKHETRNVSLRKKVPVLIAYWTVDIAKDGYVSFKPDVYGQDAKVLQALDDRSGAPG